MIHPNHQSGIGAPSTAGSCCTKTRSPGLKPKNGGASASLTGISVVQAHYQGIDVVWRWQQQVYSSRAREWKYWLYEPEGLTPDNRQAEWVGHRLSDLDDIKLAQLLQEAEDHLRQRTCRQRYEAAVFKLPDSRRNIRLGDQELDKAA